MASLNLCENYREVNYKHSKVPGEKAIVKEEKEKETKIFRENLY